MMSAAGGVAWRCGTHTGFHSASCFGHPVTHRQPARSAHGALHIARTVVRRTERAAVGLQERGLMKNADLVRYLNRLSDLVWLLAEYEVTPEVSISTPAENFDHH